MAFKRKLALLFIMVLNLLQMPVQSQILQPVTWSFTQQKKGTNVWELQFTATMDQGWYIYGFEIEPGGPIATSIDINKNDDFRLLGGMHVPMAAIKFDPNFNMELSMYSREVTFRQSVEVISENPVRVAGELVFMCCNATSCLPPDFVEFAFNLPGREKVQEISIVEAAPTDTEAPEYKSEEDLSEAKDTMLSPQAINFTPIAPSQTGRSYWGLFITGLLGGLLALLTPCVFPMIPLTVSFFLRNADNRARAVRDAFFYGFTIIFSYVVLGLAISMIFGAHTLNALATSPGFNLFFFALLVFFAASFFGAFELTMPSNWSTALDNQADKTGGVLGVILMGFTFVLVSFSCTGPIVGTLLVDAATGGNVFGPAIGMLGFSLALAIPFSLFAVFPTALKTLPKSGGWMNAVKVVLGFIVLAFSLKFLGTADAVAQWGILDREVFLVLWIAIFLLMGLYLIGKIKFAHDSDLKYMSVPRLVLAIVSFAFVFYLLPGLWGAPLRAVSSFLPSPTTQDFDLNRGAVPVAPAAASGIYAGESVKTGPHGLMAFTDFYEGMEAARKAGKPVFLDFTGLGCANCRKMESGVWSDSQVKEMLRDDFVKISLFVDDRTQLPESEQFVSSALGRERNIRTVGQKWSVFQAERYNVNTQPYYVILNHDEQLLAPPRGYDLNIQAYIEFLEEGKRNFGD